MNEDFYYHPHQNSWGATTPWNILWVGSRPWSPGKSYSQNRTCASLESAVSSYYFHVLKIMEMHLILPNALYFFPGCHRLFWATSGNKKVKIRVFFRGDCMCISKVTMVTFPFSAQALPVWLVPLGTHSHMACGSAESQGSSGLMHVVHLLLSA